MKGMWIKAPKSARKLPEGQPDGLWLEPKRGKAPVNQPAGLWLEVGK